MSLWNEIMGCATPIHFFNMKECEEVICTNVCQSTSQVSLPSPSASPQFAFSFCTATVQSFDHLILYCLLFTYELPSIL